MPGRGSIRKRQGKGGPSCLVRVEFPRDPVTGERVQRAKTFHKEKEAEKQLTKWLADVDRGVTIEPDIVSVGELCALWLDSVAAFSVDPSSLAGYRYTIEHYLIPQIGGVVAQKLTSAHVQKCYADLRNAGRGARTVELCHRRLSQVLKHAATVWQVLPGNVCERVKVKPTPAARGKTWNRDEALRFLGKARDDGYWPLWLLILTTGMRRGEALGLRWQDFDVGRATATIRQKVILLGGKATIRPRAKTPAGERTVKLAPELVAEMVQHRKNQIGARLAAASWEDNDLIFSSRVSTPINPNNALRNFYRLCDAAKVERIKIHGMRHTHATWLLNAGRPVGEVAQRLGHARPSITTDTYYHAMQNQQDASVEVTRDILFRAEEQKGKNGTE